MSDMGLRHISTHTHKKRIGSSWSANRKATKVAFLCRNDRKLAGILIYLNALHVMKKILANRAESGPMLISINKGISLKKYIFRTKLCGRDLPESPFSTRPSTLKP